MKNWFTPRTLLVAAGVLILALLVWRFSSIVAYIIVASVISLMARPLVRILGKIHIGKWQIPISIRALLTLLVVWTVFFGFFRLFIPLVAIEVQELSNINSEMIVQEFEGPIERLEQWIGKLNLLEANHLSLMDEIQIRLSNLLSIETVTDMLADIASVLGNLAWAFLAISFISFFLLREEELITGYIVTIFPEDTEKGFTHALESIKRLLRRYFIGILLQITGILILVTLGMTIIGVGFRLGLVIGLVAAVLNIIPYLGPLIGSALGILLGVASHLDLDFASAAVTIDGLYDAGLLYHPAH